MNNLTSAPPEPITARARALAAERGISFRAALSVLGSRGAAARRTRRVRAVAVASLLARRWGADAEPLNL